MHFAPTLGAALLVAVAHATPGQFSNTGDHCTDIKPEFGGWTGKTTNAVSFANFPGSYKFTNQGYDAAGNCQSKDASAEGPIAPLSDEMHFVFRGPIKLVNFAMYTPGASAKAKRSSAHAHGHSHQRFHEAKRDAALGDHVKANINGVEVDMVDTWSKPGAAGGGGGGGSSGGSGDKAAPATNQKAAAPVQVAAGQWGRTAHYTANGPASDGLTFLQAQKFTDSVSFFASADGKLTYSATHQNLAAGALVPDNTEFYIASSEACTDANPCGMAGPNVTAYHGFKGDRMAVFEFAMPLSGDRTCDTYNTPNPDMPCIWSLATHVVNNLQYGDCNGWTQGAGEHDIVEVLSPGSKNMFASMHMGKAYAGTECDSFERPVSGTMKMAVLYSGSTVHQQVLNDFDFGATIDSASVQGMTGSGGVGNMKAAGSTSVMQLIQG